jgi:antitoxin (DNA-binding transcriptional repressor) of toxin-antitoxin stability system
LSNAERRYLRRKFNDSLAVTRDILNPRNQLARFVERKTTQAKQVAGETIQIAKHNAPVIGIVGMGALLFAARRQISRWISSLRKSKIKTPSSD